MSDRLGGEVGRKPMHFFFVLDVSGSMRRDGRIQALNNAIREVVPQLRDEALANPHAQLLIRVLAFATEAHWVVERPTPVEEFRWRGVDAVPRGLTELGLALRELARCMRELAETGRGFPPAIILVSDGHPTHTAGPHFATGLQELMAEPWGRAAVRLALGVGRDADMHSLRRFIGREDVPLVRADNPQQLTEFLVWASKAASRGSSMPVIGDSAGITFTTPEVTSADPIWNPIQP
jgi:uncharacterized protein YegL